MAKNVTADIFIRRVLHPSKERKIANLKSSDFENAKTDDEISVEGYVKKLMALYVFELADLCIEGVKPKTSYVQP